MDIIKCEAACLTEKDTCPTRKEVPIKVTPCLYALHKACTETGREPERVEKTSI